MRPFGCVHERFDLMRLCFLGAHQPLDEHAVEGRGRFRVRAPEGRRGSPREKRDHQPDAQNDSIVQHTFDTMLSTDTNVKHR